MRAILFAGLAILVLAIPAAAEHCTTWETSNGIAVDNYYVYDACVDAAMGGWDQYECQWWGPWTFWIYEEANGIPGLQRADELRDDTCHSMILGDKVIW